MAHHKRKSDFYDVSLFIYLLFIIYIKSFYVVCFIVSPVLLSLQKGLK